MKWWSRHKGHSPESQKGQVRPSSAEGQKIPQVITGEKLLTILKLQSEFMKLRNGGQVVTGILGQITGLIMNDDTTKHDSVGVITHASTTPLPPYTTFIVTGMRSGLLRVRLYAGGITIDQLSTTPNYEEILRDPEDWVYFTIENFAVGQAIKLLSVCYPQRAFKFVYGTDYFKEPCTNRKIFISSLLNTPTQFDAFVIVKDRYADLTRESIKVEYLWSDGGIYALEYPINKPYKPNLTKIKESLL
ncbi:MAG: hypothetical protein ABR954_04000 [Dehalococcoidales bacterium]